MECDGEVKGEGGESGIMEEKLSADGVGAGMSREELLQAQEEESRLRTERRLLDETMAGQAVQTAWQTLSDLIESGYLTGERLAQGTQGRLQDGVGGGKGFCGVLSKPFQSDAVKVISFFGMAKSR